MNTKNLSDRELASLWGSTSDIKYANEIANRFSKLLNEHGEKARNFEKIKATLQKAADSLASDAEELASEIETLLEES